MIPIHLNLGTLTLSFLDETSMTSDANGDDWSMSSCDEYVDGSIYRVKLHNFLTYNDAEFHPGPRLNLILGPNGTGKYSVVCALCVGLGGSTKVCKYKLAYISRYQRR